MKRRRTISKLAKEAGVGVETVRFYERRGILRQPQAPLKAGGSTVTMRWKPSAT
jgi:MerR family transcriptional regulator, mercuric resistance operon regulatory protein